MFSLKTLPILVAGALALAGCTRSDETKTTTETKTERVGSTEQSSTTTKVDAPAGDTKSVTNTFVGTVTQFERAKHIKLMTGDQESHSFDLDGENDVISIDARTAVGSKVRLVEEKLEGGTHTITVTIAPAA